MEKGSGEQQILLSTIPNIYMLRCYTLYNCSDKVLIGWRWKYRVVSEARGRLFRRKDGKYLIYLPLYLAKDSMFPFKGSDSVLVKVSFKPGGGEKLIVERWKEAEKTIALQTDFLKASIKDACMTSERS
jgi:hypothetical protein